MSVYRGHAAQDDRTAGLHRLQALRDRAVEDYITKLRARYGKYARPAEEARRILDQAMGSRTLTEVLYKMREEGP